MEYTRIEVPDGSVVKTRISVHKDLSDMKCSVMAHRSRIRVLVGRTWGAYSPSKSDLTHENQLPGHESIWEPVEIHIRALWHEAVYVFWEVNDGSVGKTSALGTWSRVMGLNPSWVELNMCISSVFKVRLKP